jgi:2,3-bisphosphoglycerate-independent phosphoglycerate mutase
MDYDMKYIIAILDGATDRLSDYPNGDTPLQAAATPTMDQLANCSEVGWAKNVPEGYPPGSDVACLSIFGFNPAEVYSGRAPLEAANMGLQLGERVAFRCNLVTIENGSMKEFTAGHISTEEADQLIKSLQAELGNDEISFHTGVQYRHITITPREWNNVQCTPPHDIIDQNVADHLPQGEAKQQVLELMERSKAIFENHPVNLKRAADGKAQATQIWLWGQGTKPQLTTYQERFDMEGGVISAVDLIQGIGRLAGLEVIKVEGATGLPDTNYEGKAQAALQLLKKHPFVLIHVESTDEMGHAGDEEKKTIAASDFDQRMLKILVDGLWESGEDFRILLLPDHPTPIALRTHTSDPVPFFLFDSRDESKKSDAGYSEQGILKRTKNVVAGHRVIELLCQKTTLADEIIEELG